MEHKKATLPKGQLPLFSINFTTISTCQVCICGNTCDVSETKCLGLLNKLNPLNFGGQNVVNEHSTNKTDHQKNKPKPLNSNGVKGLDLNTCSFIV